MNSPVILDTHILLWTVLDADKLAAQNQETIEAARSDNQLLISSISLWEIAMLQLKKRINIYEPTQVFLDSIVQIPGLSVQDILPSIAAQSANLMDDFHGDPADRIIVATAKVCGAVLLTRDSAILKWAACGHIRAVNS